VKGIVLAGGNGSRLYPVTKVVSKQLLPVYDKPMIYYPIYSLFLCGIKDILVICKQEDKENFYRLLGDGADFGLNISYAFQEEPRGIGEAFIIGEDFAEKDDIALILGDNIFYHPAFKEKLREAKALIKSKKSEGVIFGCKVSDPERFGVVEFFDDHKTIKSIVEKPKEYISDYAVTGLYFYNNNVISYAKELEPSLNRNELEITDINNIYLKKDELSVVLLEGDDLLWLDTGTPDSLLEASLKVRDLSKKKNIDLVDFSLIKNQWGF